uniref:BPI1 domain-containing protein n=1 Tax=Strongyloides stercoralis TaxID=6248 RepID=A0A0K0E8Y7_STRER
MTRNEKIVGMGKQENKGNLKEVADSSATINADFHEDKGPLTFTAKKIEIINVDLSPNPTINFTDNNSIHISITNLKLKVRVHMLLSLHFGIVNTDNSYVTITATINKGSINLITNIIKSNISPLVKLTKTIVKADEFDFDVEGNILILALGKVLKLFKSKFQKLIENRAKEEFKLYFEKQINNKLKTINTNRIFGNEYTIKYNMTGNGFINKKQKINLYTIPLHGGMWTKNSIIPLTGTVNNQTLTYNELKSIVNKTMFEKTNENPLNFHLQHPSSVCYYFNHNLLWRYITFYTKITINEKLTFDKSSTFDNTGIIHTKINHQQSKLMITHQTLLINNEKNLNLSLPFTQLLLPSTKTLKHSNIKIFSTQYNTIICSDVSIQLDCLGFD